MEGKSIISMLANLALGMCVLLPNNNNQTLTFNLSYECRKIHMNDVLYTKEVKVNVRKRKREKLALAS